MAQRKSDRSTKKMPKLETISNNDYENEQFYASRIKTLRNAANINQTELANALGLTRATINNWESGRSRPDASCLPMLCRILNVSQSDFYSLGIKDDEYQLLTSYRHLNMDHQHFLLNMAHELEKMDQCVTSAVGPIRLLKIPYADDAVAAGVGTLSFEAACTQRYVHDTPMLRGADILFRVNGDSMEHDYPDGSTVMVRKDTKLKSGEIGVFSVDGTLYIKEYTHDGLRSLNPAYPLMRSSHYNQIQLIGRVTGIVNENDFASETEIADYEAKN